MVFTNKQKGYNSRLKFIPQELSKLIIFNLNFDKQSYGRHGTSTEDQSIYERNLMGTRCMYYGQIQWGQDAF